MENKIEKTLREYEGLKEEKWQMYHEYSKCIALLRDVAILHQILSDTDVILQYVRIQFKLQFTCGVDSNKNYTTDFTEWTDPFIFRLDDLETFKNKGFMEYLEKEMEKIGEILQNI